MSFVWRVIISAVSVVWRPCCATWGLMFGQTLSDWPKIWQRDSWRYFKTIRRIWLKIWYLRCCYCWNGWLCCEENATFVFWDKQCRNGLKFDVEPSSGISRPTVCSVLWNKAPYFSVIGSSCLVAGRVKPGQMMLEWPRTWCVHSLRPCLKILKFSNGFDKIWCLTQLRPSWPNVTSCDFFDVESVWRVKVIFFVNTHQRSPHVMRDE